jgi:hypothetical protein
MYAKIYIRDRTTAKVMSRYRLDSGLAIPIRGYKVFINRPENIKKATLRPTAYKIVSTAPILCSLKILRRRNPGMNVRYRNPTTCLRTGKSMPKRAKASRPQATR